MTTSIILIQMWLKCLNFANFLKTYDHVKTLLVILPGPWKGPMQVSGSEAS